MHTTTPLSSPVAAAADYDFPTQEPGTQTWTCFVTNKEHLAYVGPLYSAQRGVVRFTPGAEALCMKHRPWVYKEEPWRDRKGLGYTGKAVYLV